MSHIPLGLISLLVVAPTIFLAMWLFYMIHAFTEKAESLLPNSSFVEGLRSTYEHAGLIGKAVRNGVITLALMMPNAFARKGLLDIAEAKNFPHGLKYMLFASWGLAFAFLAAGVALGVYLETLR
jgi:hypothetical protein